MQRSELCRSRQEFSFFSSIYWQMLASIQQRTSLSEFDLVSHSYPAQRFNFHIGTKPRARGGQPASLRRRSSRDALAHFDGGPASPPTTPSRYRFRGVHYQMGTFKWSHVISRNFLLKTNLESSKLRCGMSAFPPFQHWMCVLLNFQVFS